MDPNIYSNMVIIGLVKSEGSMSIFNIKKKKIVSVIKCCNCGRKLGEYVKTAEIEDGTDDIYNVCPDCYKIMIDKISGKEK